jgi:hypothetical protein
MSTSPGFRSSSKTTFPGIVARSEFELLAAFAILDIMTNTKWQEDQLFIITVLTIIVLIG